MSAQHPTYKAACVAALVNLEWMVQAEEHKADKARQQKDYTLCDIAAAKAEAYREAIGTFQAEIAAVAYPTTSTAD